MQIDYLTDNKIKKQTKKCQRKMICDGNKLYLRFTENGHCSWVFRYINSKTKQRRMMGLGSYPAISIEEARHRRNEALHLIASGKDPIDEKRHSSSQAKVGTVFTIWCNFKKNSTKKFSDMESLMNKYLISKISNVKIADVTAPMVADILRDVVEEKTILATVHKIIMYFNQMMEYAISYGYISNNPCAKISNCFETTNVKHMASVPVQNLKKLFKEIAKSNINIVTLYLLLFNIFTFVRPNEASNARWSEFDFKQRIWTIPQERMKMHRVHRVPLSDQVMMLLRNLKKITGDNEYLFPQVKQKDKPINSQTINLVLKKNGFKGKLVSHGFRAMASSYFYEKSYQPMLIEASLAHICGDKTVQAYNRTDFLKGRVKLMQDWSDLIEQYYNAIPDLPPILRSDDMESLG